MTTRKSFTKTTIERRRLYIDYGCWLPTDENLTSFSTLSSPVTPEAPLTIDVAFTDAGQRKLAFYTSGGKPNTNYLIQLIVHTNQNQIKRDDISLRVLP